MALHKKNERDDQLEDENLTDELVEWARAVREAASDSMPDGMEPPQGAQFELGLHPSGPESMPSGTETAAPMTSKQQLKVLVVAADGSSADRTRAHLFDDTEGASQFIKTLVESGLNPNRIIVFRGTPMSFNVTYLLVVTIGEPGERPTVSG